MSDLAATNCGCEGINSCSLIWIILLLNCFCGGNNGTSFLNGNGGGCGNDSCLIILLLLLCGGCGGNGNNGSFFNNGNGCGCGC